MPWGLEIRGLEIRDKRSCHKCSSEKAERICDAKLDTNSSERGNNAVISDYLDGKSRVFGGHVCEMTSRGITNEVIRVEMNCVLRLSLVE